MSEPITNDELDTMENATRRISWPAHHMIVRLIGEVKRNQARIAEMEAQVAALTEALAKCDPMTHAWISICRVCGEEDHSPDCLYRQAREAK